MGRETDKGRDRPERPELAADDPEEEGEEGRVEEERAVARGGGRVLGAIREADREEEREDEAGDVEDAVEGFPAEPFEEKAAEPPDAERDAHAEDADNEHFVKHVARTFVHVEVFDSCSVHSGRQGARAKRKKTLSSRFPCGPGKARSRSAKEGRAYTRTLPTSRLDRLNFPGFRGSTDCSGASLLARSLADSARGCNSAVALLDRGMGSFIRLIV